MSAPQSQKPSAASLSLQEKHEHALNECDRLITHFRTRADRNKYLFKGLKYSSIILSIGVTVLAALPSNPLPWTLPAVAGLAALCTTMLSASHAQELWVLSRNTQKNLQVEKFNYCQGVRSYSELLEDAEKVRHFSERVIEIWSGGHEVWQENVSEKLEGKREASREPAGPDHPLRGGVPRHEV